MNQQIHFITYGNNLYKNAKKRLYNQANNSKWFNSISIYSPENLSEEFKNEFNDILQKPRGAGYWIWKFDIIRQHLSKINNNDILIYIDAGCSINPLGKQRFDEYIKMLNNSNECIISFKLKHLEKKYTIKELFKYFNMETDDINGNTGQIMATVLIMKKTDKLKTIIDECINVLRYDHLLVTDYYNKHNQCKEFIDNRHDQSILSLIRKKYGSIVLNDETWFTNFSNKEALNYPFWATRNKN